jgi:hypothetical protein
MTFDVEKEEFIQAWDESLYLAEVVRARLNGILHRAIAAEREQNIKDACPFCERGLPHRRNPLLGGPRSNPLPPRFRWQHTKDTDATFVVYCSASAIHERIRAGEEEK